MVRYEYETSPRKLEPEYIPNKKKKTDSRRIPKKQPPPPRKICCFVYSHFSIAWL